MHVKPTELPMGCEKTLTKRGRGIVREQAKVVSEGIW
jgi:hypothetical protein